MAQLNYILGTQKVIHNLRRRKQTFGLAYSRGLRLAGLFLQRESQKLVPVDTGNLKASAFTRAQGALYKTKVFVGYTASYAIYVHENRTMLLAGQKRTGTHKDGTPRKGKYWDPQGRGQNDFLAEPARTRRAELLAIIQLSIRKTI